MQAVALTCARLHWLHSTSRPTRRKSDILRSGQGRDAVSPPLALIANIALLHTIDALTTCMNVTTVCIAGATAFQLLLITSRRQGRSRACQLHASEWPEARQRAVSITFRFTSSSAPPALPRSLKSVPSGQPGDHHCRLSLRPHRSHRALPPSLLLLL